MKKRNLILSILLFLAIIFITFYVIFSEQSLSDMTNNLKLLNYKYLFIILVILISYFFCQGLYYKVLFKAMNTNITIFNGTLYSIVEFLFNAITPGASGGQPVVLYFMSKDKIQIKKSMILILLNTIIFKIYLIIGGILIIIFKSNYINEYGEFIKIIFYFGIIWDFIVIACYAMLIYNQKLVRLILKVFYIIYDKLKHNKESHEDKINNLLKQYSEENKFISNHKKELLFGVFITFIQRTLIFSIVYVIYRGFGFNEFNYIDLLLLQIFVQITIEAIFLPGGSGINEFVTNKLFITIFGGLSLTAMVLYRIVSFYIPLLIIMFILIIVVATKYNEKNIKN